MKPEDEEKAEILEWKRPDQVMRLHRLKMKKRALQARMNGTSNEPLESSMLKENNDNNGKTFGLSQKRKNPFAVEASSKRQKETTVPIPVELEGDNDNTLFELLHLDQGQSTQSRLDASRSNPVSFASVFREDNQEGEEPEVSKGSTELPIDWTLNTKMRFMSPKPFPWNGKLKTSEQASGTTGFVRCLDIGELESTLDTSPNARFHRCCLAWQHPSLPWLELFPRIAGRISSSISSVSSIGNNHFMKEALYREWSESFRSLFHLLRARQCPYFYVCANSFTALFRAAGICGLSEVHALVTPTTRGFRQSLKQEEIEFTMLLRKDKNGKRRSDVTDSGCDTFDSTISNVTVASNVEVAGKNDTEGKENNEKNCNDDDEDHTNDGNDGDQKEQDEEDVPEDEWLHSLGVEDSEIRRISNLQTRMLLEKESEVDNTKQSLIFVKGVEAQALFNFLLNCKSSIATTGPLAGIPPTLLAPVAFHGATLKPLKVRESVVQDGKDRFHSIELRGPLLPHILPSLCHLMKSSQLEQFSVSCAQLQGTTAFSLARHGREQSDSPETGKLPQNVFGQENLSDCGFSKELLTHFCHPNPNRMEIIESLKYSNELFSWT